ncbi:NUDIX hydrolase [bacterium]|nr:NUDIX hydrolase [bacterium]
MFVTDDMLAEMERLYGVPDERTFGIAVNETEFKRIRDSQIDGRNHDVTIYIRKENQVAVIAKHIYPPDLYRAPSGGLKPGEDFHVGAYREVAEETGCEVKLTDYVLRTSVAFTLGSQMIFWRSFVFLADYLKGNFQFTDHNEIRSVRWADWLEFAHFGRIMRQTSMGGLHYRAVMHEELESILRERELLPTEK